MSKSDTKNRGELGYFLPEEGQFRLRKLHQHIEFLSRLAEPRVDEEEDGPEIDHPALAGCLELLAKQVQQVLDMVRRPARLEGEGKPATAEADQDFAFGMTLDQLDASDRLLDLLRAQDDLLMAAGGSDVADGTITVIGAAIFEGADEMKDLIRQINAQVLGAPSAGGRVREMPAVYGIAGGTVHVH